MDRELPPIPPRGWSTLDKVLVIVTTISATILLIKAVIEGMEFAAGWL